MLTEVSTFTGLLNKYVTELTKGDQKGVLATIPDVTAVPYFTTVTRELLIAGVNAASPVKVSDIYIKTKMELVLLQMQITLFYLFHQQDYLVARIYQMNKQML